jgi:hypothetical protein
VKLTGRNGFVAPGRRWAKRRRIERVDGEVDAAAEAVERDRPSCFRHHNSADRRPRTVAVRRKRTPPQRVHVGIAPKLGEVNMGPPTRDASDDRRVCGHALTRSDRRGDVPVLERDAAGAGDADHLRLAGSAVDLTRDRRVYRCAVTRRDVDAEVKRPARRRDPRVAEVTANRMRAIEGWSGHPYAPAEKCGPPRRRTRPGRR